MAALIASVLAVAAPAAAQVTVEQVASGFTDAVALCAKAQLAGGGIADLSEADRTLVVEGSASTREFTRTPEGRPAWDVVSAEGIVAITEPSEGECNVQAYGPHVQPTFDRVAENLTAPALAFVEEEIAQTPSAILRAFTHAGASGTVRVVLDGGEPGMPGRMFRFPMLLASVKTTPSPAQ